MASLSLQTNVGRQDDMSPDASITTGTAAPTSSTFEFRWNQAASGPTNYVPTRNDAINALYAFIRYVEDGRFNEGPVL